MRFFLFLCLLVLTVSACSGGGSGGKDTVDPIDELPKVITPEPDPVLPMSASYRGPASLSFSPVSADRVDLTGTMSLTVYFDNRSEAVTGSMDGIETAAGTAVTGQLVVDNGSVTDTPMQLMMASRISGELQSGADRYEIAGQMSGEVLEDNQSAVTGTITGTAQHNGGSASLSGSFQTGRQP